MPSPQHPMSILDVLVCFCLVWMCSHHRKHSSVLPLTHVCRVMPGLWTREVTPTFTQMTLLAVSCLPYTKRHSAKSCPQSGTRTFNKTIKNNGVDRSVMGGTDVTWQSSYIFPLHHTHTHTHTHTHSNTTVMLTLVTAQYTLVLSMVQHFLTVN